MSTIKEYWHFWLWRDNTARIITVNTAMWIIIAGVTLVIAPSQILRWVGLFGIPADPHMLPYRFWTIATYMVSQYEFLHLLVNMLWLMLFGRLVEMVLGSKTLLQLYIAGGLAGGAAFIIANAISLGSNPLMLGASCSVLCLIAVAALMLPSYKINLLIFGSVKIMWIAAMAIVLFVILEPSLYVSIAHCGGLLAGVAYVMWRRRPKSTAMPCAQRSQTDEAQLDTLLQKVSRSGYASLTASERQRLFELSQKIKK